MNAIDIFGLVFAIVAFIAFLVVIIAIGVMLVNNTTGKATKIRIEPLLKSPYGDMFAVQRKRWWGWQTVYTSDLINDCVNHIKGLSEVRNVEWVKD